MAEPTKKRRKVRFVLRHSSVQLKILVLCCIVVTLIALLLLRGAIVRERERKESARLQAAQVEQENEDLAEGIGLKGTIDGIMRVAREKLGLLPPGSEVYETQPK